MRKAEEWWNTNRRPPGRFGSPWVEHQLAAIEFCRMLVAHDFKCAICRSEDDEGSPLVIDHCHRTGRLRGLLCRNCNLTLGRMESGRQSMQVAFDAYLRKYPTYSRGVELDFSNQRLLPPTNERREEDPF